MNQMFSKAQSFNADVSKWDVSSVTNMQSMFNNAHSFNSDISKWDVSSVTNMQYMFYYARSFSRTLCGAWKTSKANKDSMFSGSPGRLCWVLPVGVRAPRRKLISNRLVVWSPDVFICFTTILYFTNDRRNMNYMHSKLCVSFLIKRESFSVEKCHVCWGTV